MNHSANAVATARAETSMTLSAVELMLTPCSRDATMRSAQTTTAATAATSPRTERSGVSSRGGAGIVGGRSHPRCRPVRSRA